MSTTLSRQDATAGTRGTLYGLFVAVAKCYELRPGQRVLVEELGDVTVDGEEQVEVKQYSAPLTDSHPNLWNTLRNWIDPRFEHTPFRSLILHTTQEFSATSSLVTWNDLDTEERTNVLVAILARNEAHSRTTGGPSGASHVLLLQRYVLASERRARLLQLLPKVFIEARRKTLPDLFQELIDTRVRGILVGKKADFLHALFGFACRLGLRSGQRWEITYEQWEEKLADLTATYSVDTRRFPLKHFVPYAKNEVHADEEQLFVRKLLDIDYPEAVSKAVSDYEATMATLLEEFQAWSIEHSVVESYVEELLERYLAQYRTACRRCADEVRDSQTLYDEFTSSGAAPLQGFGDTPTRFRNGLIHQRMDIPHDNLKWRVTKS